MEKLNEMKQESSNKAFRFGLVNFLTILKIYILCIYVLLAILIFLRRTLHNLTTKMPSKSVIHIWELLPTTSTNIGYLN